MTRSKSVGVNIPLDDRGDRVFDALRMMKINEDRSMSRIILRIIEKHIAKLDAGFQNQLNRFLDEERKAWEKRGE